jgi:putative ABC transport system ATP-binding protein
VLGRQAMAYSGRVMIDGFNLGRMSVERASHLIGYAGSETEIIAGSLRDNILLPLKRRRPNARPAGKVSNEEYRRFVEAIRSGNTPLQFSADWTDYEGAGLTDADSLAAHVKAVLEVLGCAEDVYELGLDGKVLSSLDESAKRRVVEARGVVAAELSRSKLTGLIETFDPERYNANATVSENLIFGALMGPRFANETLLFEPYAQAILTAEALIEPLVDVGSRIVATVVEIFAGLPQGHALFERYSFGANLAFERLSELAAILDKHDMRAPLDPETERDLVALALGYIEPKHRLNLLDDRLRQRVLRARASFKSHLPADARDDVAFYDPAMVMPGASLRDNLMFGRVGYGISDARKKVASIVRGALSRAGLEGELYRIGLNTDAGMRGRHLPTRLKLAVPLAQALIKRPQIAVLDLSALLASASQPEAIVARLREHCAGMTLFLLLRSASFADGIAQRVVFNGPAGTIENGEREEDDGKAGGAPPAPLVSAGMEARP